MSSTIFPVRPNVEYVTKRLIGSCLARPLQVRDEDVYKGGDLSAVEPFGEVFQQEKQFEEDVFEPEYEEPFGEKSFMEQHPLFGDFGVKSSSPPREVDPLEAQLVESPEHVTPDALNDPEEAADDEEEGATATSAVEEVLD